MSDALLLLRSLLDTIAHEQNYDNHDAKITPITTGGGNYTAELFLVNIKADDKDDLQLFAKVANINGKLRDEVPITTFYENERYVYETLVHIYGKLQDKNKVPDEHRLYFPKYYGCNPKLYEETIVLEDLTAKGFGTHDRFESIDWEYAYKAVIELAKFHALSFAYAEENPEEFAKLMEDKMYEMNENQVEMMPVWEKTVEKVIMATKEENKERLEKYLQESASKMKEFYKPLRRPVLTHGDFRPSNLMHRVQDVS